MEEHRCKIAGLQIEDPRCHSLVAAVMVQQEDQRCEWLSDRMAMVRVDSPGNCTPMLTDDPRCRSLRTMW
jgi:hypothetical protein